MKNYVKTTVIGGLCAFLVTTCGCASQNRMLGDRTGMPPTGQGTNVPGTNQPTGTIGENMRLSGTTNNPLTQLQQQTGDDRKRCDTIRKGIEGMEGIDKVNVVVSGNTALVGYASPKPAQDTDKIKTTISNKVKQLDKNITNVAVSESSDVMTRIGNIYNDITNKKPADKISNEINNLFQELSPKVQ